MFKTTAFDKLLDKATSKLLLDPDWDTTMQICDSIRQGDVQPIYAVQGIRKKIENENPFISRFALQVLESVVKNCGTFVHNEIATRDFMDFIREQAKVRQDPVKGKILELVQVWSYAFRNEVQYKVVQDTFNVMKAEGAVFPALKESDAMFMAEKAPEWRDGECCHRCRVQFSTFQRKHHCRACGQVFCQKCSSKASIIPKYGIEKEVRVCESCFENINKLSSEKKGSEDDLPAEYLASSLSKQPQVAQTRSAQEIQEEEELQLALAISQSEAEATKDKARYRAKTSTGSIPQSVGESSQPLKVVSTLPATIDTSDMDPELARYLNRNYWQQKSIEIKSNTNVQPSAPLGVNDIKTSLPYKEEDKVSNGDTTENDDAQEQFLRALHSSIEILVNRMKSDSARGRSIANDSSVQTLFMTLNAMHPQLVSYIQDQEEQRAHYESLQDKLTQLKDARDALDVLREEHQEKKRREQEEMERQRQVQMMQKLEILRQKKQEYLEYQRQLALQRMQDQEMEMRRRLEQQKQDQQMRAMQYVHPQMYGPAQSSYGPTPSMDGSPLHQMHAGGMQQNAFNTYPNPSSGPGQMGQHSSGIGHMPPAGHSMYTQYGSDYNAAMMKGYHVPPSTGYIGSTIHGATYSGPPLHASMYPNGSIGIEGQSYNIPGMSNIMSHQQQVQPAAGEYPPPQSVQGQQYVPQQQQQQSVQNQSLQPGPNESALINFD
jgi:growth factor-regulated tyrosine kinase substrate